MAAKAHGTSAVPPQQDLRWGADRETADRISNFNRHYAEHSGYWEETAFAKELEAISEAGESWAHAICRRPRIWSACSSLWGALESFMISRGSVCVRPSPRARRGTIGGRPPHRVPLARTRESA